MKIRKCPKCKTYTLKEFCPKCNQKTIYPNPPRYSPQDKFGKFRREALKEIDSKNQI